MHISHSEKRKPLRAEFVEDAEYILELPLFFYIEMAVA